MTEEQPVPAASEPRATAPAYRGVEQFAFSNPGLISIGLILCCAAIAVPTLLGDQTFAGLRFYAWGAKVNEGIDLALVSARDETRDFAHLNRAAILIDLHRGEESLDDLAAALKSPDSDMQQRAHLLRGKVHMDASRYEKALTDLEAATGPADRDLSREAYEMSAFALGKLDRPSDAAQAYRKSAESSEAPAKNWARAAVEPAEAATHEDG